MVEKHPHAAAIERLGRSRIYSHFNMSRQGVDKWMRYGVPRMHHRTLAMLGALNGISVPEFADVPSARVFEGG